MLVIGLAGGIASGKSFVASCFVKLGAKGIDADRIGHQVLDDSKVKKQIRLIWGKSVFESDKVNREAIAKIVFDRENENRANSELKKLESITHPEIKLQSEAEIELLRNSKAPAVVLDAPVMFKAGWHHVCDKIVFVEVPREIRLQRTLQRGWSEDELTRRESFQLPLAEKRSFSSNVIDNSLEQTKTLEQVETLWRQWELPPPPASICSN